MEENQLVLNKAFMTKNGCLKLQYNKKTKSIYLHIGKKKDDNSWDWIRTKIEDSECGIIIALLKGKLEKTSFFHKFNGNPKRTWVNKDDNGLLWVRIEDYRHKLKIGQQKVFEILLEKAIVASNAA